MVNFMQYPDFSVKGGNVWLALKNHSCQVLKPINFLYLGRNPEYGNNPKIFTLLFSSMIFADIDIDNGNDIYLSHMGLEAI